MYPTTSLKPLGRAFWQLTVENPRGLADLGPTFSSGLRHVLYVQRDSNVMLSEPCARENRVVIRLLRRSKWDEIS